MPRLPPPLIMLAMPALSAIWHAIEIVAFERGLHDGGVGMAGDADESRHLLFAELEDLFEDAAFGLDFRQVLFGGQRVNVEQIDAVHLQGLEALLDGARGFGSIARADFGGEEDAVAAPLEHLADALLGQVALAVLVGGIDVGDARVERLGKSLERRVLFLVHEEAAAGAEGENGDARAGLAEYAGRKRSLAGIGGNDCRRSGGGSFDEFASCDAHGVHFLSVWIRIAVLARRPAQDCGRRARQRLRRR